MFKLLRQGNRLRIALISGLILFCLILFYFSFYTWVDASFIGTLNGVWKTLGYLDHQKTGYLESGNVFYYEIIDILASCLSLNEPMDFYKVIVMMNGVSSALLHSSLFLFAYYVTKSIRLSWLVTIIHFLIVGNFILSFNNEDIYPSYFFYLLHVFSFYVYLNERIDLYGYAASFFAVVSLFFHWTTGIVALVVFYPCLIYLMWGEIFRNIKFIGMMVLIPSLLFVLASKWLQYPISLIVYPAKAMGTLWIGGVDLNSLALVSVNSFSYYFFGVCLNSWNEFNSWHFKKLVFSLLFLSPLFFFVIRKRKYLSEHSNGLVNKKVLVYLGIVFLVSSIMNAYEQGNNLQFLIQPSFLIVYLFLMLLLQVEWKNRLQTIWLYTFIGLLVVLVFNKSAVSVGFNHREEWCHVELLEECIEDRPDSTLFIGSGFVSVMPLAMLKWGGKEHYNHLDFPTGDNSGIHLSDEDYLSWTADSICYFLSEGFKPVVINFIDEPARFHGQSFNGHDMTNKISLVQDYLISNFTVLDTLGDVNSRFRFYILEPKRGLCR